ncbi:MAG: RnfABCDGE type electron transport complex subunit D [Candidatus Omnitrophica bacterium]|nr:RnfABCDGE type electron transport complex subunit D [Candidatus Omnitrophota bacterium]
MKNNLYVITSPYCRARISTSRIMWTVSAALLPATTAAIFLFGKAAFIIIVYSIIASICTEAIIQYLSKKPITIFDGSAFLTGLLVAFNLPPTVPWWIAVIGSVVAIGIGKQVFGGLGQNIFNPALVGRVFLMASWPHYMTNFTLPFVYDAVTSPTPLTILKHSKSLPSVSYWDLFLGLRGGCIGEVCIAALLLGAIVLLFLGYISLYIPLSFIATVGLLTYLFGPTGIGSGDWLFHLLSGGLILGAFFMATDYVTSPLTKKGQIIFGIGCGIITTVIRLWGGYPEGVSYAILIMNAVTPVIDNFTKTRIYGTNIKKE